MKVIRLEAAPWVESLYIPGHSRTGSNQIPAGLKLVHNKREVTVTGTVVFRYVVQF